MYSEEAVRLVELEELEKLKQTLLLTVSHELKTPLTAIKAGTEMLELQENASVSSAKGRLLRSINRGVERLERLVDESLDYARMQDANLELELELTDLAELYEETITLLTPAARAKRQTLELDLPEYIPSLEIDRRRCERVLLNLVSNATRYTQPGGKITVGVNVETDYGSPAWWIRARGCLTPTATRSSTFITVPPTVMERGPEPAAESVSPSPNIWWSFTAEKSG